MKKLPCEPSGVFRVYTASDSNKQYGQDVNNFSSLKPLIPYIKLTAMSFFFGGVFVAGKTIVGEVEPAIAAFLRFAIATLMLLLILLWKEKQIPIPTPSQFAGLAALGLTGVLGYNLCLLIGLETVSSSRSSVIVASNPVFITLMSVLFLGDRLTRRKLIGIGLSVSGAVLVASHGSWNNLTDFSSGDLAILVCAICWATYSVIGRYVLNFLSPLVSVTYASAIGLSMLLPFALYTADFQTVYSLDTSVWIAIIYMGVFGTVCAFLLYYQGIQALGVVRAGAFINLIPVSAIMLALFILNEEIDVSITIGTLITIFGIFLINSRQKTAIGTNQ